MTTTTAAARDTIVTRIESVMAASLPALPRFYENAVKVDLNTVGSAFIQIEVTFEDTIRESFADANPVISEWGHIGFRFFVAAGAGSRVVQTTFDALKAGLQNLTLTGGVQVGTPRPGRKGDLDGWAWYDLHVPFLFYTP